MLVHLCDISLLLSLHFNQCRFTCILGSLELANINLFKVIRISWLVIISFVDASDHVSLLIPLEVETVSVETGHQVLFLLHRVVELLGASSVFDDVLKLVVTTLLDEVCVTF